METILAKNAGFCFGVQRAVDIAYKQAGNHKVYTFGPIIHNEEVVKDLEQKGVFVLHSLEEAKTVEPGVAIIRSHGTSKANIDALKDMGFEIVDTTCPFVKKIHSIANQESKKGHEIIIIGNEHHAEVDGIIGWCENTPTVIDSVEKAMNYQADPEKEIVIISQTTFNLKKFQELVDILTKKYYNIRVCNTICNATEVRQTEARSIAQEADAMIVIGGKSSSNTQKLYDICSEECEHTYYIQTLQDLDLSKLDSARSVGITAGASTPNTIIQEVFNNVRVR